MKLTNHRNLPAPILNAIKADLRGRPPRFGVTTLIRPARQVALEIMYFDEMEEDAMDRVWALFGTAMHKVLELADDTAIMKEEFIELAIGGVTVMGRIDRLWADGADNVLTDYKTTAARSAMYGKMEWEQQLNIEAAILEEAGTRVDRLEVAALLRDWNRTEARAESRYPQTQFVVIPVLKWEHDAAMKFIADRISAHRGARDVELPLCTDAERWARPEKWAVMQPGKVRAKRVLDTLESAMNWSKDNLKGPHEIVHRPGADVRCEDFCSSAPFCEQFKSSGAP